MASSRKYHGIHKQQLFHWIASKKDRETGLKGALHPDARREYLDCLRGSFETGIWVNAPRTPETIKLRASSQTLDKAMACFTEWTLNESMPHTTAYGRMGLGFAKSWLIKHGGQPVTYFDHSPKSPFLKTLISLLKHLRDNAKSMDELLYLIHFTKRIHKSSEKLGTSTKPAKKRTAASKGGAKPTPPKAPDLFARSWSKTMPYLEEREWRIVEHPTLAKQGFLVPNSASNPPKFHLPYKPGTDLFTLVLPDNQTVSEVLRNNWFTKRLFPKDAPHVTVLSLQDIGTF